MATPFWIELATRGRLATMQKPMGGPRLKEEIADLKKLSVELLVSLLEPQEEFLFELADEGQLCHENGIRFASMPIPDFSVPASEEPVKELARTILADLRRGSNVVIHCHGGIGRSTLLAASVLVLMGIPPAEAFGRISRARGRKVPETPSQAEWVEQFAKNLANR